MSIGWTLQNINLNNNSIVTSRNLYSGYDITSIDINQTNGNYSVCEPRVANNSIYGRVIIYPQSPSLSGNYKITIQNFNGHEPLIYPVDAKFDYTRNKIWICDVGNSRVIKVDLNVPNDIAAEKRNVIYPHALAINYNDGSIYVKAFIEENMNYGVIIHCGYNGVELGRFIYENDISDVSSSSLSSSSSSTVENSSSSSSVIGYSTSSSSSSSMDKLFPVFPSYKSIVYDHMRSRLWWINNNYLFVLDERNKQVITYLISKNDFSYGYSLDVEFKTGNVFAIVGDVHDNRYIAQFSRDNNGMISKGWLE